MDLSLAGQWRTYLACGAIAAVVGLAGCGGSSAPAAANSAPASSASASSAPASSAAASSAPAASGSSAPSGSSGSAAGQHVTITGTNSLRFSPMTVHVHAGAVRVTLKDMGAYPHNIVIPGLHVTSATVTGDPGSGSASFTVTFPRSGHYAFHCQYHQSSGMVGVFVVS